MTNTCASDKTLLILGAAAVQNDAVLAAQEMGVKVLVAAQAADGPAAESADQFVEANFMDLAKMRELLNSQKIDVVYSTGSDLAMPVSMALSEEFGLPHFVSKETALTCNNKIAMRERTQNLPGAVGFSHCSFADQEKDGNGKPNEPTVVAPGSGPWIVKPADAQGQRGIQLIDDEKQIPAAAAEAAGFSRTSSAIVEEYIGGTEVSVNGYLVDGEIKFLVVSDRVTWPEFTGLIRAHSVPSRYSGDANVTARLHECIAKFAERLGIVNGPVYAQVKIDQGDVRIIEITPRLDGCHMWHLLSYAASVDLMKITLRHLVFGERPEFPDKLQIRPATLEFLCQQPNTPAEYPEHYAESRSTGNSESQPVAGFRYYREGQNIRPVNGRFDKIGYEIRFDPVS